LLRKHDDRKITAVHSRERKGRRKTKGNGVNPASGCPIYRGPPNLSVAVPSIVQCASMALSSKVREEIKEEILLNKPQLRPKFEFRSLVKKTTSGRLDGKSFCKPPPSH
jgi:hypothetical protein